MISRNSKNDVSCGTTGLIILAASKHRQDYYSIFRTMPALVPFNGKPLIYQTIMSCLKAGMTGPIVVALPETERHIESLLSLAFEKRAPIYVCYIKDAHPNCQTETLQACLEFMDKAGIADSSVFVANGDIYFEWGNYEGMDKPIAFVDESPISVEAYPRFYTVTEGALQYADKGTTPLLNASYKADCGLYYLPSWHALMQEQTHSVDFACPVGKFLIRKFGTSLELKSIGKWEDLGNLSSAATISTKVLGVREFNSLQIDEKQGILCKSSRKREKILQEINYYLKLPSSLSIYFPRLQGFDLGKKVSYSIEYYPYKTLSEFFVMYELPKNCWERVIEKLFDLCEEFRLYTQQKPSFGQYAGMYSEKLKERMALLDPNSEIGELVNRESVLVNERMYKGWKHYLPDIEELVRQRYEICRCTAIHGDMCFSNILYEPSTNIIKFIDPRGEFYEEGIYGDPDYDISKLMHSILGNYDYILHQMYILNERTDDGFTFDVIQSDYAKTIKEVFLSKLSQRYSPEEVRVLSVYEALLFLSMLPLHSDDLNRQKAFYLTALNILDQTLN